MCSRASRRFPNIAGDLNPWTDTNFRGLLSEDDQHQLPDAPRRSGFFGQGQPFRAFHQVSAGLRTTTAADTAIRRSGPATEPVPAARIRRSIRPLRDGPTSFTPSLLNEFQLSGHRSSNLEWNPRRCDQLGRPNSGCRIRSESTAGRPFTPRDSQFLYYGGWDGDNHKGEQLTQFQIDENVTWVKNKHTLKFGFKGRQEHNNIVELQQAQGSDSFYGDWTAQYDPVGQTRVSYTGSGFASVVLGLPTYLSNQYNRGYFYFQQKEIGLYANDTWQSDAPADPGSRVCVGITGRLTTRSTTGSQIIDLNTLSTPVNAGSIPA